MKLVNIRNGTEFIGRDDADIVSASIQAGCTVDHSCRRGVCGQCAGLVREGAFANGLERPTQIVTPGSKPVSVLMCQTFPRSDLTVECNDKQELAPTRAVKISSIAFPTREVAVVDLDFMDGAPFAFQAGQFIAIRWAGDRLKYFSIASTEGGASKIQLHVRRQFQGEFTGWLFEAAKKGDIVGLDGPFGSFVWSTPDDRPIILMATGTGFSPIKSLVETQKLWARTSPVFLYWGGQTEDDVYDFALARQWAGMGKNFHFIPVAAAPVGDWTGRRGFLQECVAQDHASLAQFDVYACGSPVMIARAQETLVSKLRLPSERFFTDSFNTTPPLTDASVSLTGFEVNFQGGEQGRIYGENGRTLLQVLMRAGLNLDHYCGGGAVCGTCRVKVEPALVGAMNEEEADLLECLQSGCAEHRLACQFAISQEIAAHTVYLPGTPGHVSDLKD